MKIGLVDVDGHNFPNIALMKIASWHRMQGDTAEWAFPFEHYDRIYMSKVFTFTPDDQTAYQCQDIRRGGTGYDIKSRLPDEIDRHTGLAYDLYLGKRFLARNLYEDATFKEAKLYDVDSSKPEPSGEQPTNNIPSPDDPQEGD